MRIQGGKHAVDGREFHSLRLGTGLQVFGNELKNRLQIIVHLPNGGWLPHPEFGVLATYLQTGFSILELDLHIRHPAFDVLKRLLQHGDRIHPGGVHVVLLKLQQHPTESLHARQFVLVAAGLKHTRRKQAKKRQQTDGNP